MVISTERPFGATADSFTTMFSGKALAATSSVASGVPISSIAVVNGAVVKHSERASSPDWSCGRVGSMEVVQGSHARDCMPMVGS